MLNYDDTVERSLGGHFEDGYEQIDAGLYRFEPRKLAWTSASRVMHLHGSVHYGFYPGDPNRFRFEDKFEDLYITSATIIRTQSRTSL